MNIVADTNVIVSGLLSPHGPPGEIIQLLLAQKVRVLYDSRIFMEYEGVLLRPRLRIPPLDAAIFLAHVHENGQLVAPEPLGGTFPDPSDKMFLEAALAGSADCMVTGNLRHFPERARHGVLVVSPADFLNFYRKNIK